MITANELRLGNLVRDIHSSDKFFADVRKLDKARCYYGLFHSAYEDLVPIPLTPEILEKCGFEDKEYTLEKDGIVLSWASRIISTGERCGISVDGAEHINSLHLLQNYYYFKTGEELTINLK